MPRQGNFMEEKQFKTISAKLDTLIRIVALTGTKGLTSTESIKLLNQAGISPKEIAEILGTTANAVNVRLSEMRKRRDKK